MKVLWFANTSCNADEYLNMELKDTGGWLKALDVVMQDHVELNIAFYSETSLQPFIYKGTNYFPIYSKRGFIKKVYDRMTAHVVFEEHKDLYLEVINQVKPDIIHIHGSETPFGCIINSISIPVVISIQGNITVYYHKYFSGIEEKYLKTTNFSLSNPFGFFQCYRTDYRRFFKMMLRERKILLECKHIIGRTDWDYRISRVFAPNSRYYYNNEILRDYFYSNKNKWKFKDRDKKVIFTTSGAVYYKGLETICQALFELQLIGFSIEWRIAGINVNDLIVKIVKNKLGKKFPDKGLVFLGKLNGTELVSKILDSDIYVMPSHIENSPNNLCEAMLLGIPSIATCAGGTSSILKDGEEGIIIQDGDPWVLSGAILQLINSKEDIYKYNNNAYKRAFGRHDKHEVYKGLIKIYEDILKE